MKFLKSILLVVALATYAAFEASAGQYDTFANTATSFSGGTNVVGLTTNSYTTQFIADSKLSEYVGITFKYTFFAAPVGVTPTVIARYQRSQDSTNWETAVPIVATMSGATNSVVWHTNIFVGASRYLRLNAIENTNSTVLTNVTLWWNIKR